MNLKLPIFVYCIIFFLTSCSMGKESLIFDQGTKEIKVYFTKSKSPEEISFVPVKRKVHKEDSSIDATLRELFLGPTKKEEIKGIMTEIPLGTRLIKVEESDDDILIDLSSQFLTGGGSATMQLRYLQLYKTLKNIAFGKTIYLYADGKSIKTIGGEGLEVSQPLMNIGDYTKKPETSEDLQP